jgi:transaldolase
MPQRLLWASTGVKDKSFPDTKYVVDLVAKDTVNTMPEATLRAVADHGVVRGDTIRDGYATARKVIEDLRTAGIDIGDVADVLEKQGVASFEQSWEELIASVTQQIERAGGSVTQDGAVKPAGGGAPAAASLGRSA